MNGSERPGSAWRPIGLRWTPDEQVALEWDAPAGRAPRLSPLPVGGRLAVLVGADRRCVGVRHAGRRIECPLTAPLAPAARRAQCEACGALAATNSVATDTSLLDDKREYAVYLAHHGELIKVGISRTERGSARLLEQGALASVVLSTGSLPAARRVERLLGAALGLPDRVSSSRKRRARARPGTTAEREAALAAAIGDCQGLNWPSGQARRAPVISDHAHRYPCPRTACARRQRCVRWHPGSSSPAPSSAGSAATSTWPPMPARSCWTYACWPAGSCCGAHPTPSPQLRSSPCPPSPSKTNSSDPPAT
ncbi:DUF2797 domain-containing protein [Kitasatospora acidiphila]|uniref:DUF2797 domain-containing protein n=1 Tax=Kitasatospora acidiphila TaxID=2567942 RepID=UPI001C67A1C7|nr:DUF2797 domain-containing protein [Kitasatospora acidiphila]